MFTSNYVDAKSFSKFKLYAQVTLSQPWPSYATPEVSVSVQESATGTAEWASGSNIPYTPWEAQWGPPPPPTPPQPGQTPRWARAVGFQGDFSTLRAVATMPNLNTPYSATISLYLLMAKD